MILKSGRPIYGPGGWVEVSVIYKASSEAKNGHWLPWIQNENTFLPEKSCTLWQMWSDLVQLQAFLLNVLPHIQLALLFHITYLPIYKYICPWLSNQHLNEKWKQLTTCNSRFAIWGGENQIKANIISNVNFFIFAFLIHLLLNMG